MITVIKFLGDNMWTMLLMLLTVVIIIVLIYKVKDEYFDN